MISDVMNEYTHWWRKMFYIGGGGGLIHEKIMAQVRGILTSHENFRELNKK